MPRKDAAEDVTETIKLDQRNAAVLSNALDAIIGLDQAGRVVGWNPAAEQLFGYTAAEAQGRPLAELIFLPQDRESLRRRLPDRRAGTSELALGQRLEVPAMHRDGHALEIELSISRMRAGEFAGFARDISARKRAEAQLVHAKEMAEAAARAKSTFLATMSHEIRTPMNAIMGMAGLLNDTPLDDEQRDYANIVRSSSEHLLTVINDILDYSKLESGKLEMESLPFKLDTVIEEALDFVAIKAREKSLELAYEVESSAPSWARADSGRIRQVLVNYLSNAVKFTPEGGEVIVTLDARAIDDGYELHFAVRDNGIGIDPAGQARLFQSFSQVDNSIQRRYGGTGLGLAICKLLAENLGGRAWVESTPGAGSTFHFTAIAKAHEGSERVRWTSGPDSPLAGLRVWIVDDNATNRRILRKHCERWGMVVRETEFPLEALQWESQEVACDLVLLDYHMPVMDGVQLANKLHQRRPQLKMVLLSSGGPALTETEAHRTGLLIQAMKPLKLSNLFEAIVKLFERRMVNATRAAPTSALPSDMAQRHPLRILVAEDNAVNVKLISLLLGKLGYRADVAGNGREAIEALKRQSYDVVLMDVQMPEMDGIQATRVIQATRPPGDRPRIIALTAGALSEERQQCLDAGMDEFLTKPLVPARLVEALEASRRLETVG